MTSILALQSLDGLPEMGGLTGLGGLIIYLINRVSKLDTRCARIEGRLFGPGDTEQIERKGSRHYRLPLLFVFMVLALFLAGCNVTRYQRLPDHESFVSWNLFQTTKLEKFSTLQKTNSYSFRSGGSSSTTDGDALERFFTGLRKLAEQP